MSHNALPKEDEASYGSFKHNQYTEDQINESQLAT